MAHWPTAVDVVMPQMGVSVSEGTITKWLKQEGEHVEADEPLLEISTDKVDTEVPSPGAGDVTQILVQEGETVDVGTKLAVIGGAAAEAGAPEPEASPEPATAPAAEEASPGVERRGCARHRGACAGGAPRRRRSLRRGGERQDVRLAGRGDASPPSTASTRPASPGTGRGGRVTKKDILAFVESGARPSRRRQPRQPAAAAGASRAHPRRAAARTAARAGSARRRPAAPAAARPAPAPQPAMTEAGEQLEPMSAMRRGIAEHMRRSLDTSAHVTSAIEVDMSKVVAIRSEAQAGVPEGLRRQHRRTSRSSRAPSSRRSATTRGSTASSAATRSSRATTSTSASRSSSRTARA